jgi:FixJ family two-component response regulator
VIEADAAQRDALARRLAGDGHVVSAFPCARSFLERPPDSLGAGTCCLVAALPTPGVAAEALLGALRGAGTEIAAVFLSDRAGVAASVRAMHAGAVDVLERPVADEALREAVARALARAQALAAERAVDASLRERYARLTRRERDVVAVVVTGLTNKQIGARLGASEKMVKVHRARAMVKMGARSLPDLVRMADRLGIAR